jgi:uncharacterized protein (DUF305 family)
MSPDAIPSTGAVEPSALGRGDDGGSDADGYELSPLLSGGRLLILVVALCFLAGAVGYLVGHKSSITDPLSATDVGFMRDMDYHHAQAVEMSDNLVNKPTVDPDLKSYAMEIIKEQSSERGFFNATLDRFGHPSSPPATAMTWMGGRGVPRDQMEGRATSAQVAELRSAKGDAAAALWIALMSEHHLGGVHMADYEARHGHDTTVVNLATCMVRVQRGEVIDLQNYRKQHKLAIPDGFTDPMHDPRLNPISFTATACA